MAASRRWVTVTAASALGIGVLAGGAIGAARAMPLVDSTTVATVPPITIDASTARSGSGSSPSGPSATPAPVPTRGVEPNPGVNRTPETVAPRPAAPAPSSSASPVSPVSPASIDEPDN